jgi:hypothetical protein
MNIFFLLCHELHFESNNNFTFLVMVVLILIENPGISQVCIPTLLPVLSPCFDELEISRHQQISQHVNGNTTLMADNPSEQFPLMRNFAA